MNLLLKSTLSCTLVLTLAACASNQQPEPEPVEPAPVVDVAPEEPEVIEPVVEEPTVEVPTEMVNFAFDSDEVTADQLIRLEQWAFYISSQNVRQVQIHGHADEVGTESYNKDLSARRAHNTAKALLNMVNHDIQVEEVAHGETQPLSLDSSEQGRQQNRRVEISIPEAGSVAIIEPQQ